MSNAPRSVEQLIAEFESQQTAMDAELKALGLPDLDNFNEAGFDDEAAYKGYPDIVRLAQTGDRATLAQDLAALLNKGADPNAQSPYCETAIAAAFDRSAFDAFGLLLDHGAKLPDWGWGPVHMTVAKGGVPEPLFDPMARDSVGRTPYLLACRTGNLAAAKALLPVTPDAGQLDIPEGNSAMFFAAKSRSAETLGWLLSKGCEINARDRHGATALLAAVQADDLDLVGMLLDQGADPALGENISQAMRDRDAERTEDKSVLAKAADVMMKFAPAFGDMPDTIVTPGDAASSNEMARLLAEHGTPIGDFDAEMVPAAIGADQIEPARITPEMFAAQYRPRPGTANPERVDIPFWREQIRTGTSGFSAAHDILGNPRETPPGCGGVDPVWSFQRFGRTATRLADGRWVLVAGEHEDHYDPDFCIYADVTVIHPQGAVDHYIYPADVFPPTDFHSATLVGDRLLLIGNYSYQHLRTEGATQVLSLDLTNFAITRLDTSGENPGWISRHDAEVDGQKIIITGGKIEPGYADNPDTFALDIETLVWSRL